MVIETIVPGLSWEYYYTVESHYIVISNGEPRDQWKTGFVASNQPLTDNEIFDIVREQDSQDLESASEGSSGTVIEVISQRVTKIARKG